MTRGFSRWNRAGLARAARFVGVGGLSTATYWVVLLVLIHASHLVPSLSSVFAYMAGVVTSFTGHRFFTYRSRAEVRAEAVRFLVTSAICFFIGNTIFWLASSVMGWSAVVAGLLLTGANVAVSYIAAELWVFNQRQTP